MALELEQTLYNLDVVRYHHFTAFVINPGTVKATLSSFRNRAHRELPVLAVLDRGYEFAFNGDVSTLHAQAYQYLKTLPEWAAAVDV
jgi:hypothetical protein